MGMVQKILEIKMYIYIYRKQLDGEYKIHIKNILQN